MRSFPERSTSPDAPAARRPGRRSRPRSRAAGSAPGDDQGGGAELRVTRDFGQQRARPTRRASSTSREADTVMRFLQSERKVDAALRRRLRAVDRRPRGRRARAAQQRLVLLRQRPGGRASARPTASCTPATSSSGTTATGRRRCRSPAIVGAFPEPFVHGFEGKKLPVRVECADPDAATRAARRATGSPRTGVTASGATLGTSGARAGAARVRRPWSELRERARAAHARAGPRGERRVRPLPRRRRAARAARRATAASRARAGAGHRPRRGDPRSARRRASRSRHRHRRRGRRGAPPSALDARHAAQRVRRRRHARRRSRKLPASGGAVSARARPRLPPGHERAARRARRRRARSTARALALVPIAVRAPARAGRRRSSRSSPPAWPPASAREMARGARLALPIALMIIADLNPLVRPAQGDTLLVRGDEVLGHRFGDITLEALVYGAAFGLRVGGADPGLRALLGGRRPGRDAAAAPALRLPLGADGVADHAARAGARPRRLAHERRRALPAACRPAGCERARAALHGALDRAVDVAAALEVRGYGDARRPRRARARRGRATTCGWRAARVLIAALRGRRAAARGRSASCAYPRIELDARARRARAVASASSRSRSRRSSAPRARLGVARA